MDIQVTNRKHIHVFILFLLLLFRVILGLLVKLESPSIHRILKI